MYVQQTKGERHHRHAIRHKGYGDKEDNGLRAERRGHPQHGERHDDDDSGVEYEPAAATHAVRLEVYALHKHRDTTIEQPCSEEYGHDECRDEGVEYQYYTDYNIGNRGQYKPPASHIAIVRG